MITYRKNCKACQVSKNNSRLRDRIYASKTFNPDGIEFITEIADDVGVSRWSMSNHCKKHVTISVAKKRKIAEAIKLHQAKTHLAAKVMGEEEARKIIEQEAEIMGKPFRAEVPGYVDLWDAFIALGENRLKNGTIQITAAHILKAAADKADWESKQKDRQLDIVKSIASFAAPKTPQSTTVKNVAKVMNDKRTEQEKKDAESLAQLAGVPTTMDS